MKATMALIRKDRWWLGGFLLLGSGVTTATMLTAGYERLFVLPGGLSETDLILWLAVCSLTLGAFAALRESLTQTRDYLWHRPIRVDRILWTRALVCVAIVASWPVIGAALLQLHERFFGIGVGCIDPHELASLAAGTVNVESIFAVVLFTFTLPLHWMARVLLALPTLFTWGMLTQTLDGLAGPEVTWSEHVLIQALLVAGFLTAAVSGERSGRDPDRPLSSHALLAGAPISILVAFVVGWALTSWWQRSSLEAIEDRRPEIWRVSDTELALVGPKDKFSRFRVLVSSFLPTERAVLFDETRPRVGAPRSFISVGNPSEFDYGGHNVDCVKLLRAETLRLVTLERESGLLRVVDLSATSRHCWTTRNPVGKSFSEGTFFLTGPRQDDEAIQFTEEHPASRLYFPDTSVPIVLIDPGNRAAWRLNGVPPELVPVPLPEEDIPLEQIGALGPDGTYVRAVHGTEHPWFWTGDRWLAATEVPAKEKLSVTLIDPDPLCPEIEVRSHDGLVLRHRYDLTSTSDTVRAGMAKVVTLLLPAPTALLAIIHAQYLDEPSLHPVPHVERFPWPHDPLLGGGYAWLLWPNLVLTGALAARAWIVLRRRGASRRRALGWTLAVLSAGVSAWLVLLAFEPHRAWRRPAPSQPAPVRIRAA